MCPARIGTGWAGAETLDTVLEDTHCTAVLERTVLEATHFIAVLFEDCSRWYTLHCCIIYKKNILVVKHCTVVLLKTV